MLGKGKLAELRALARTHKLASGSQTVPNSVVEIAAAQGRSPPQVLAAGFDATLEQVACQYPELDLSMVSICNEVVDGKIVPSED